MKKEELYETLEGIDDKFINEADIAQPKKKSLKWIKWMSVAACLCLCFCCTVSVLVAAGNEYIYEKLYSVSPAIAQKLKPINVSCEDNGIEMTVVAAEVDGENTTILMSMCDNVGDRLDETTDLFDSYSIHTPYDQSGGCSLVDYDDATKTATFVITIEPMDHVLSPGDKITFSVSQLLCKKEHSDFKITQINTENIQQITAFKENPDIRGGDGAGYEAFDRDNLMLIKPDEVHAISLTNGVTLTGCGIVDGTLHIQLRFDDIHNTDNHGYIYLKNQNGEIIVSDASFAFWDESHVNSYEEYVFSVTADELADHEIWGEFWTCNNGPIKGNWQVTFSINRDFAIKKDLT